MKQDDFAAKLGVTTVTLQNYFKSVRLPSSDFIKQTCVEFSVHPEWLLMGSGPMRRGEAAKEAPAPAPAPAEAFLTAPQEEFRMSDMLTKTAEVLESDTIYRTALASNINAFHQAVRSERTLARIEERMAEWEAKTDAMVKRMEELERENRELKQRLEPSSRDKAVGAEG
ncbi:helix-turn-helix domain-containing protein [Solidesulfovibrio carbinolicus]|nr:helix-turn-helix transcriptional regulator [Solidesulfovibrio carbinolicus]